MTLTSDELDIILKLFYDFTLLAEYNGESYRLQKEEIDLFTRMANFKEGKSL